MKFDELFESLPKNGWLKREEALLLLTGAVICDGPILEVGSYYGRSTCLLAALGRPVYAVDPFSDFSTEDPAGHATKMALLHNLQERRLLNVTVYHQRIEDWAVQQAGFAYLDGDHTYLGSLNQIQTALSCGVQRLCIHDWCEDGDGRWIKQAVEDSPRLKLKLIAGEMAYCEVT